jgi:hypothetical protein
MAGDDRMPKIKPTDLRVECPGCGGLGYVAERPVLIDLGAALFTTCRVCEGLKLLFPRKVDI